VTVAADDLLDARARVLRDLEATGAASPSSVSALEAALTDRRWWVSQWESGGKYAAGLVAQDVQDALLEDVGRWPLCPVCDDATHALYIHPEIGGPDPVWVCEETSREVAPLGSLSRPTE
jgi:hypothetical protein